MPLSAANFHLVNLKNKLFSLCPVLIFKIARYDLQYPYPQNRGDIDSLDLPENTSSLKCTEVNNLKA